MCLRINSAHLILNRKSSDDVTALAKGWSSNVGCREPLRGKTHEQVEEAEQRRAYRKLLSRLILLQPSQSVELRLMQNALKNLPPRFSINSDSPPPEGKAGSPGPQLTLPGKINKRKILLPNLPNHVGCLSYIGCLTYHGLMTAHFNSARSLTTESNMTHPPVGICTHCRDYTRNTEQINQKCPSCNTGLFARRRRKKDWQLCAGCADTTISGAGKMERCYLCRGSGWTATLPFGRT
jgi:hypothetical protein